MEYVADRVYHALKETEGTESLQVLLKSGLNPDNIFLGARYPDADGKTFLQICCSDGDFAKIELLIKHGCHVNYGMREVISPNERRLSYEMELDVDDLKRTCLYYAICSSNEKLVKILLTAGADVTIKCKDDMTALMHAVDSNNLAIVKAISECRSCDINSQDIYGLSALHIAVIHGRGDIVHFLLERRARVDVKQCQGGTALFMVSNRVTLDLLLRYGSDPNHCAGQDGEVTVASCVLKKARDVGCIVDLLDAGCKISKSLLAEMESHPPVILANNPDVLDLLRQQATRPVSLKLQAVTTIRAALLDVSQGVGLGVYKRCELLPLPRLLREYVRDLGLDHDDDGIEYGSMDFQLNR